VSPPAAAVQTSSVDTGDRIAQLEARIAASEAALRRIVEVNERLLIVAMETRADADTAAMALQEAQSSATLDALTGLPNRSTMTVHIVQAIAHARRRGGLVALLFLDLDGFKRLNDTWGHGFGDSLLCLTAARMRAAVREEDVVSRHGGDEFLVLLADLAGAGDARGVAEKLAAAIAAPAQIVGHQVRVTASIGIAFYPGDGEDMPTLVECADAAMYEAKRQRAGGIALRGAAPVRPAT